MHWGRHQYGIHRPLLYIYLPYRSSCTKWWNYYSTERLSYATVSSCWVGHVVYIKCMENYPFYFIIFLSIRLRYTGSHYFHIASPGWRMNYCSEAADRSAGISRGWPDKALNPCTITQAACNSTQKHPKKTRCPSRCKNLSSEYGAGVRMETEVSPNSGLVVKVAKAWAIQKSWAFHMGYVLQCPIYGRWIIGRGI